MVFSVLTDDVQTRIVEALRAGATAIDACEWAGVERSVFHDWSQRGRAYERALCDGAEIIDGEDRYRQFWIETSQAKAFARVRAIGFVSRAMTTDWRPAAWFLERSDPDSWGRVNRTELSGPGGRPLEVADVTERELRLAATIHAVLEERPALPEADD